MIETMQKRINEIKQQDRKSYYEIANEIGISESTLYNLMSKGQLFTPAEQKIIAYLRGYITKDEKLEAYRLDNDELKAENDRLKQALNKEPLAQKALVTAYSGYKKQVLELYKVLDSYKQILQEIKTIAEDNIDCKQYEIDHDCFNDTRCKALRELIETLQQILDLITKAEEE